ncbi:hypothetical protein GCM10008942_07720 [Rhizomicrobium electricum]|uniref:Uncharacterized protein n=1 Tax=Rhizomicrobium electricum TaxID=480070 RepID=A0ABP3PB16_9PROT
MANSPKSAEAVERLAAALRENLKRRKAQACAQGERPAAAAPSEASETGSPPAVRQDK